MSKAKTLFSAQGGQFLRPEEHGSTIQWNVVLQQEVKDYPPNKGELRYWISGSVNLSDCSRWISWGFDDANELRKIDNAIVELRKARAALKEALRLHAKLAPGADE